MFQCFEAIKEGDGLPLPPLRVLPGTHPIRRGADRAPCGRVSLVDRMRWAVVITW